MKNNLVNGKMTIDKLARMVAKGFGDVSNQISDINKQIGGINKQISGINRQIDGIAGQIQEFKLEVNDRFNRLEDRLEIIEDQGNGLVNSNVINEQEISKLKRRASVLETKVLRK